MNAIPRPAVAMIPVQRINVGVDLADLPDDSHYCLHLRPVALVVWPRTADRGRGENCRLWLGSKRAPESCHSYPVIHFSLPMPRCLELTARMLRFVQASCDY